MSIATPISYYNSEGFVQQKDFWGKCDCRNPSLKSISVSATEVPASAKLLKFTLSVVCVNLKTDSRYYGSVYGHLTLILMFSNNALTNSCEEHKTETV